MSGVKRRIFPDSFKREAVTGLRRGELFGLKWQDVDFTTREVRIVRSVVDQIEGPPKTFASRRPLPLSDELAAAFSEWRRVTDFGADTDGYSRVLSLSAGGRIGRTRC
jgi:integrase